MDIHKSLAEYWNRDAPTYDLAPSHIAHSAAERAAWNAALLRYLPPPPARILDLGAGTGALALPLARLGYRVTALDLSDSMLERLRVRAAEQGLEIETVTGPAETPPAGPFDAVVERLLLWTLVDPEGALVTWRQVARSGRLVSFGGVWGVADKLEAKRARARHVLHRVRRRPPEHHRPYDKQILAQLPLGPGTKLSLVIEIVENAGWRHVRVARLRDVEWARTIELPLPERLLGVTPEFAVIADDFGAPDGNG